MLSAIQIQQRRSLRDFVLHFQETNTGFQISRRVFVKYFYSIIVNDVVDALDVLGIEQKLLSNAIFGDVEIREYRLDRRKALENVEATLIRLQDMLPQFAHFIGQIPDEAELFAEPVTQWGFPFQDALRRISTFRRSNDRVFQSLLSSVSIVESKLGIAEAESKDQTNRDRIFLYSSYLFCERVQHAKSDVSIASLFYPSRGHYWDSVRTTTIDSKLMG